MMGETMFSALLVLFWLGEFTFASLVVYWFVTQGFTGSGTETDEQLPLENRTVTRNSLLLWTGFFGALLVVIILGA